MEITNKQKDCKEYEPNTKGYCIYGVRQGYHINCLKHTICWCPFAWKQSKQLTLLTAPGHTDCDWNGGPFCDRE